MEINIDFGLIDEVLGKAEKGGIGGGNIFLGQKQFPLDFKLLQGLPNLQNLPFFPVKKYWVNRKPFVSPATFGLPCPINEEVEEAKALIKADPQKYKDLQKLLDSENFQLKDSYLFIGLHLNFIDEQEMILDAKDPYNGGKIKILELGAQSKTETLRLIRQTKGIKSEQFFLADSFVISYNKTGEKKNTKYSASYWPNRMHFTDLESLEIPDIVEITRKQLKSDNELRNIVRNYLYGEALENNDDAPKQEFKAPQSDVNPLLADVMQDSDNEDLPF